MNGHSSAIALLAAISCAACQSAEHRTDASAVENSASELCDGSSGIRLVLRSEATALSSALSDFIDARGSQFMIVDGKCHYHVSNNIMTGIVQGDLSETDEAQLRKDIGWENRVAWQGVSNACADGILTLVAANDAAFACDCGSCPDAGDKSLAIANVSVVIDAYVQRGEPLSGAVRALATPDAMLGIPLLSWPLVRPIASIDGLVWMNGHGKASGASFDDASEQAGLRALRTTARSSASDPMQVPAGIGVQEQGVFSVYVRDELPTDLDDAFAKFSEHARASF